MHFCDQSAWLCALNSSFCEIKLEKDDPRTSPMLSNYQEPSTMLSRTKHNAIKNQVPNTKRNARCRGKRSNLQ